ncbi:MAG: helix-turn-helix domain-containing protein [Candidatus Acidiferrum sp.]
MELTTSQAVRKYGVFPNVLHRMILMGRLEARKDADGRWLISTQSLERWNRKRVRRAPKVRNEVTPALTHVGA